MTLRHMKIFRAVCENGYSTTKAGQALHLTQPAISQAIKEIEDYYNIILFDRIGRRLVITQAGERFKEYVSSIETLFDDMETEMKNWDKQGTIRIGATMTIGSHFLPIYAKAYKDICPDVKIKGFCGPANILEQKILDNKLDFALSEGVAHSPLIVSHEYMDDRLIVFAAADGKFNRGQTIPLEEFKKMDIVLREYGSGTRKVFDDACNNAGFSIEPVWESMSTMGIINAVYQGLGVGVVSSRLVNWAIELGLVVDINVDGLDLTRKFYIISHKDKQLSSSAKHFLQLCNDIEIKAPDIRDKFR